MTWLTVANRIFSIQFNMIGFFGRFSLLPGVVCDYSPAGYSVHLISNY